MSPMPPIDDTTTITSFWQEFYSGDGRWSGNANVLLVDQAEGLTPGRALDLGCGEGGDAIWLAKRGWQVTGVDVSQNALDLAAGHATEAGVGEAIAWEQHDLERTFPAGSFDLVSACYLHSPILIPRTQILQSAAAAVSPGGSLLIVSHADWPKWVDPADWGGDDRHIGFPTPEGDLADLALPDGEWTVVRSAFVDKPVKDPEGKPATRPDAVLHLVRRAD